MQNRKRGRLGPGWLDEFSGQGYRMTVGRRAVMEVLAATNRHLSADDIYIKLRDQYPAIGLASVYRTVDVLERMGLVFKRDFGDGKARYEPAEHLVGKTHHHHLVCTRCKRVVDYADFSEQEMALVRQTEESLLQRHGFKTTGHLIQFNGICQACRKNGS